MIKPIANIHDTFEIYFESGSAHLRFKEGVSLESLLKEKIEMSRNKNANTTNYLGCSKSQKNSKELISSLNNRY